MCTPVADVMWMYPQEPRLRMPLSDVFAQHGDLYGQELYVER